MEIKKPNPYKESTIKPKFCGKRKELNNDGIYEKFPQSLYKIRWKYITNKSGSKEFFFTGLEIDPNQSKFAEQKQIYPGDIVILNKKGHPNDGIKAKVKKVTKSVKGLDAIKKGIKEDKNLPAYYDLKFIHPPVINLKRIKHAKDVDGKYLKKIFVKKTYKCIPAHYEVEDKLKDELSRFARLHFTKGTPFIPQQILAIESQTRSKKTLVLDKYIQPQKKDIFQILRSNYISHSEPKWNKKKTHKNVEVLVRIDLTSIPGNSLTNITSYLNCRGRKKQLKTDVKEVYKDILGGIENMVAPEPKWKIKDKKNDNPFKRPGWCNLSYKESCVNPFHTPKKDGRDEDGVKSVTENFKDKWDGRGDDLPTKDDLPGIERKDSDPPKKGGAVSNNITQNIENKMNEQERRILDVPEIVLFPQQQQPQQPQQPRQPLDWNVSDDEADTDDETAQTRFPQFSVQDVVLYQGNRYIILRIEDINDVYQYTIIPSDTNAFDDNPMVAPVIVNETELTRIPLDTTGMPDELDWDQVTDDEEEQQGGGLTKEEIQKWLKYFDNEINENDDSEMNFSLSLLPKDENETLLKLF